jgi:hypothetical protein
MFFRLQKNKAPLYLGRKIFKLKVKRKLYHLYFTREVSPGCVLEVWHRRGL